MSLNTLYIYETYKINTTRYASGIELLIDIFES